MSMPSAPRNTPVIPPIVNRPKNANAYSIGVSNVIDPFCSVNAQLKILIAEDTASKHALEGNQYQGDGKHRSSQHHQHRSSVMRPAEERHPEPGHPRSTHPVDRHNEVETRKDG